MTTTRAAVVGGLLVLLFGYLLDWAVWLGSGARGDGTDSVEIIRVVVAPLKDNKEEYYPDGTAMVDCSRSLFPRAGGGACWWLRRHREAIVRY